MPDTAEYPTLTYAEMEARYDGEWVVVVDPVSNDQLEVLRGAVIAHSPDRDELHRQVRQYQAARPFRRSASLCFAPVDDNINLMTWRLFPADAC